MALDYTTIPVGTLLCCPMQYSLRGQEGIEFFVVLEQAKGDYWLAWGFSLCSTLLVNTRSWIGRKSIIADEHHLTLADFGDIGED
jgi:hypothetical protein